MFNICHLYFKTLLLPLGINHFEYCRGHLSLFNVAVKSGRVGGEYGSFMFCLLWVILNSIQKVNKTGFGWAPGFGVGNPILIVL